MSRGSVSLLVYTFIQTNIGFDIATNVLHAYTKTTLGVVYIIGIDVFWINDTGKPFEKRRKTKQNKTKNTFWIILPISIYQSIRK
jgi:hypothetical protein